MGVLATAIFAKRNFDKFKNGDTGRIAVVGAQSINEANAIASALNTTGKVTEAVSKLSNITSNAVNPLLCVASGIRIAKDDDKYAALIEEGCAMGAMFGSEKLYKILTKGENIEALAKKLSSSSAKIIKPIGDFIQNTAQGGGWKQKLLAIAIDLGFALVSIMAFGVGKKIGQKISNRNEGAKTANEKAQEKIALKEMTENGMVITA